MTNTIQLRRGTAAQWAVADPVLAEGEPAFTTDTGELRIGDGSSNWSALTPLGGAGTVSFARAYVTSGDVTLPNTSGSWALLAGVAELSVAATAGDVVELSVHAMRTSTANAFVDVAVVTGAGPTVARYLATGTASPAVEGDPGWYPTVGGFPGQSGGRSFVATSGDIDGGNVRFRVAVLAAGTGTLYASASYPFFWQAAVYSQ